METEETLVKIAADLSSYIQRQGETSAWKMFTRYIVQTISHNEIQFFSLYILYSWGYIWYLHRIKSANLLISCG